MQYYRRDGRTMPSSIWFCDFTSALMPYVICVTGWKVIRVCTCNSSLFLFIIIISTELLPTLQWKAHLFQHLDLRIKLFHLFVVLHLHKGAVGLVGTHLVASVGHDEDGLWWYNMTWICLLARGALSSAISTVTNVSKAGDVSCDNTLRSYLASCYCRCACCFDTNL